MAIHEDAPIGCVFQKDPKLDRWVQTRSNIPRPDDADADAVEVWVANADAVEGARAIDILERVVPAFGRASMQLQEDDQGVAIRAWRQGDQYLLERRLRGEGIWPKGTMLRFRAKWEARTDKGIDGVEECHRLRRDMNATEAVRWWVGEKIQMPVKATDPYDGGLRVRGSTLTVWVSEEEKLG